MADLKLSASTFSYIYTENGLEASLHLADMGFEAIERFFGYFVLGAVIVVPAFLILRLLNYRKG